MQYKKIMMLAILLLSLFVVSAVSAADNATSDVLSVNETTEEVVSVDDDNHVILEETNVGTFTDLANEIANAKGTLNLNRNYAYSDGDDDYRFGITIDKSIIINGNGYTIDGANHYILLELYGYKSNAYAKIFNVAASNVVLKNINFINNANFLSDDDRASAIDWNGANGKITGCSFTNSYSIGNGAIYWNGTNGEVSDCTFMNSHSRQGGAVFWSGDNGELTGCSFIDCSAESQSHSGGALHWSGDNGIVSDCSFIDCSAEYQNGGALLWSGDNGIVSDCSFEDCSASRYGGAIQWEGNGGTVSDCSFERISSGSDGGVICWERPYGTVKHCSFVNSHSGRDGGAIFWYTRHGRLTDCVFIESSSDGDGGAIKWEGFNGTLLNCLFVNSTADGTGGAVDWSPNYGNLSFVSNCSFVNSRSIFNGGALYWKSETGTLSDCSFTNSHSGAYGGALYWEVLNGTVINCNFMGSTAYNGGAVYWNGVMGYIALSSFKNNAAENAGGGIYVVDIPLFGLIDPIFEGNVAQNGPDWFSESGTIEIIHSTILSAPNVSTTVGTSKNLVVTLTDFNKNALAGEEISVVLNNVRYNLNTNSKGKASLAIPTNLDPKTYVATITYAGNEEYAPSTASANVVVNKIGTLISAVYDANNNEIVATLTNANTGKAISSANIKLNLNGATATVKTNSKGQAKFSTVGLSSGTAKISYAGNSKYKSTSTSIAITVKSDIIISAVYDKLTLMVKQLQPKQIPKVRLQYQLLVCLWEQTLLPFHMLETASIILQAPA